MFIPLRIHSVHSRRRGSVTIEEAPGWLGRRRIPAAALTDIGNVYGWGKWKRAAGAGGFKPLFGCEVEIGGRRFVFLVKNSGGYANLMEIFNRREIRDAAGLVAIHIPGGNGRGAGAKGSGSFNGKPAAEGGPSKEIVRRTAPRWDTAPGRAMRRCSANFWRKSRRATCTSAPTSRISR